MRLEESRYVCAAVPIGKTLWSGFSECAQMALMMSVCFHSYSFLSFILRYNPREKKHSFVKVILNHDFFFYFGL